MARRRERRSPACPCGAGAYAQCCGRYLGTGLPAPTAERTMRSRYTAYALGDVAHLVATWHPSTRPADLTVDPDLRWTGLDVLATSGGGLLHTEATVSFRATGVRDGRPVVVEEESRFLRAGTGWLYLGGR